MSTTAIAGFGISYTGAESELILRARVMRTFITSGGDEITRGTEYDFEGTIEDGNFLVDDFTLESTDDGSTPEGYYKFSVRTPAGTLVQRLDNAQIVHIPASPSPTTWAVLTAPASVCPAPATAYSKEESDIISDDLTDTAQKANTLELGVVAISKVAVDTAFPVALGANDYATVGHQGTVALSFAPQVANTPIAVAEYDPMVRDLRQPKYLSAYASLAAAITAIGATPTCLIISSAVTIAADTTLPVTCLVDCGTTGSFSVNSGRTLTINALKDPGHRRIFSGSGDAILGRYATGGVVHLEWWAAARGGSTDDNHAFNQARSSLSNGGVIAVGSGIWYLDNQQITNQLFVRGAGNNPDGAGYTGTYTGGGTVFVTSDNASTHAVFYTSGFYRTCGISNCSISVEQSTSANCLDLLGSGPSLTSGFGFRATDVSFQSNLANADEAVALVRPLVDIDGSAYWAEEVNLLFDHCTWIAAGTATPAVHIRTSNNLVHFQNPTFTVGIRGIAIDAEVFGWITIDTPDWRGHGAYTLTKSDTGGRSVGGVTITSGTRVLNIVSGSDTFEETDLGQPVFASGKVDSYISKVVSATQAYIADDATATLTAGALTMKRYEKDDDLAKCCVQIRGTHGTLGIYGGADEGFKDYIYYNCSQYGGVINVHGALIQSGVRVFGTGYLNFHGCDVYSGFLYDETTGSATINIENCHVSKGSLTNYNNIEVPSVWALRDGGSGLVKENYSCQLYDIDTEASTPGYVNRINRPVQVHSPFSITDINDDDIPTYSVPASDAFFWRGGLHDRANPNKFTFGFGMRRDIATGNIDFVSNQDTDVYQDLGYRAVGMSFYADRRITAGEGADINGTTTLETLVAETSIRHSGTGGIGYSTGAGGSVIQATNRTTGVALNKRTGFILTNAASLAAGTEVIFTLTNSLIGANDLPYVTIVADYTGAAYVDTVCSYRVVKRDATSLKIGIKNESVGATTNACLIQFEIVPSVNA